MQLSVMRIGHCIPTLENFRVLFIFTKVTSCENKTFANSMKVKDITVRRKFLLSVIRIGRRILKIRKFGLCYTHHNNLKGDILKSSYPSYGILDFVLRPIEFSK